jgi:hypothetical protein
MRLWNPYDSEQASCVTDDDVTTVGHHRYHEVACLVTTGPTGSVVVAATPACDPAHVWNQLDRAVAAYPFIGEARAAAHDM